MPKWLLECKCLKTEGDATTTFKSRSIFSLHDMYYFYKMIPESNDVKNILGLKLPSDPRWINLAEMQLEEILTDHAYCEQKAATTCITLIQKNSEKEFVVDELSPIVTEEWGHFRAVLAELKKRG